VAENLQLFPANGKQGPASMTNNKRVNEDQSRDESEWGFTLTGINKRFFVPKAGASEKFKNRRDLYLGLDIYMHVNKTTINHVIQSL
jgi:hypothetical protein